jgi:hypothetical protein
MTPVVPEDPSMTRFGQPRPEHEAANPLIEEALEVGLRRSSYLAVGNIRCAYRDGVVTLDGCVPSYYLRQIVREIVTVIAAGYAIDDRIEVVDSSHHQGIGTAAPRAGPRRTELPAR